jgi:hypothetical protein
MSNIDWDVLFDYANSRAAPGKQSRIILEFVASAGRVTVDDVVDATDLPRSSVATQLSLARRAGAVLSRTADHRWKGRGKKPVEFWVPASVHLAMGFAVPGEEAENRQMPQPVEALHPKPTGNVPV